MNDRKPTVLIVDDVPDDILILVEILKKEYQVKAVTDGASALELARSGNPPDLILLDIMMPGMDGFEVCRRLKEDPSGTIIPVIFLTAKGMTSDEKLGLELGAVDYIKKPIEPEIVKSRIKSHLALKETLIRVSEVRFRRLFETSMDGIMIVDRESGLVIDANESLAKLLGVTLEYFLGRRVSDMEFLKVLFLQNELLPPSSRGGYVRYRDQPVETSDGRSIYVEFVCNTYTVNKREVTQINLRDISDLVLSERERSKAMERLEALLREREAVMREIHHRVNNNLQMMMSMLHIASDQIPDAAGCRKVEDLARRLHSLALVHKQFYDSKTMDKIDFGAYLRQLIDELRTEFPDGVRSVETRFPVSPVFLKLDQAVPAALIVDELLTNAMKFASPAGNAGAHIRTSLCAEKGVVTISISDDGVGMPPSLDPSAVQSLGMILIRILAEQIEGAVEFSGGSGTEAVLRFPYA